MKTLITILLITLLVGCSTPNQPKPTKIARLKSINSLPPNPASLPPKLPAKRMNYNPAPAANIVKQLANPAPAYGYSHRTGITNYAARLTPVGNFKVAAVDGLAFHGPPYLITNYSPYPLIFCGADYKLLAGHTYYFEASSDLVNWFAVHEPYFAPADEDYSSYINLAVNGFYYHNYNQRCRVTP